MAETNAGVRRQTNTTDVICLSIFVSFVLSVRNWFVVSVGSTLVGALDTLMHTHTHTLSHPIQHWFGFVLHYVLSAHIRCVCTVFVLCVSCIRIVIVSVQPLLLGNNKNGNRLTGVRHNLSAYRKTQIFSWSFNLVLFRPTKITI